MPGILKQTEVLNIRGGSRIWEEDSSWSLQDSGRRSGGPVLQKLVILCNTVIFNMEENKTVLVMLAL